MPELTLIQTCANLAEVELMLRQLASAERENCADRFRRDPGFYVYFHDCVAEQSAMADECRVMLVGALAANDESVQSPAADPRQS